MNPDAQFVLLHNQINFYEELTCQHYRFDISKETVSGSHHEPRHLICITIAKLASIKLKFVSVIDLMFGMMLCFLL